MLFDICFVSLKFDPIVVDLCAAVNFSFMFLSFQGAFRLIDDPDSSSNTMTTMHLRPSKPIDCVVRVYVIRVSKRLL